MYVVYKFTIFVLHCNILKEMSPNCFSVASMVAMGMVLSDLLPEGLRVCPGSCVC